MSKPAAFRFFQQPFLTASCSPLSLAALLVAVFPGFASPAFAEPVVTGNTISWPDDGWYQVQDATSFEEICAGGRQCEVSAGTYIVINHSNATRWDSVVVSASSGESGLGSLPISPSSVSVAGSTISWPDDGWYQVQSATSYETVCEGGLSCEAAAGTYIVINHSSGQRFENIEVGSSTLPGSSGAIVSTGSTDDSADTDSSSTFDSRISSWSTDGNTIEFLTDGWFQVQTGGFDASFETVCEGQSSCLLEEGLYQIVNHNTGEVWQRVSVGVDPLFWQQGALDEAFLSWVGVIYNHETPNYNVYLNGELVASGTRNFTTLRNFDRGTHYLVAVYTVSADGSEYLVGETNVLTTGPSMDVVAFGRPAGEGETFGFEFWDDIPAENRLEFPSDCLFAIPSGGFCYSPSTRFLIGYNTVNSERIGEVEWEFQLPGDNSSNFIEGLVHFAGSGGFRGAVKEFALVTDVTTNFADSSYEISVFNGFGTFLGTHPILEGIRFSSSTGMERQINLDGSNLRVSIGPIRPFETFVVVEVSRPRRLHIAGEYYEPTGFGNLSDLSGWSAAGGFLAVVNAETGETLSQTFYPGLSLEDVPEEP